MNYKICALIPTYNHYLALPGIIGKLKALDLPIFIIDDGSNQETQETLKNLSGIEILHLPVNNGKGAAMQAGLKWVAEKGFSHAFQVDADGQHSLDGVADFISLSKKHPSAFLSGKPVYDSSMPLARKIGRWFTHVWVWIETLSFRITDSMCGFRIYPIKASLEVMEKSSIGKRMDFDTEVMVKLFWQGIPILMHPVRVTYPEENHSNFDVIKDNWRITKMHTRLVFTMLARLPSILQNRPDYKAIDQSNNWASLAERGSVLGITLLALCYRILGRVACSIIGFPIVVYFYVTGGPQRRASHQFLEKVYKSRGGAKRPNVRDGLRHFMSFFQMLLDKFAAWSGYLNDKHLDSNQTDYIEKIMAQPKGGVILVSHLGCMEFCRALIPSEKKQKLHILLHSKNSKQFNRVMAHFNPESSLNLMEVSEIGAETIIYLKDRLEKGEWVVIAADRTPVNESSHIAMARFLGEKAPFSTGPYILASLLQCPVYTMMAIREGNKYKVDMKLFAEHIILQRGNREAALQGYAQQYADYLQRYCLEYPYQWYNFYDFWRAL